MSNATTTLCFTTLLLLLLAVSDVLARTGPAFRDVTPMETHRTVTTHLDDNETRKAAVDRDACVGLREDECIMKETIEAHLDYMYTQKKKQP